MLILADVVLYIHFLYVLCVVVPVPLIIVGAMRGWPWVRKRWFRFTHVAMIAAVVVNSAMGNLCPLTELEFHLRAEANGIGDYALPMAAEIAAVLYYDLPLWQFTLIYAAFGSMIVVLWIWVRPD